MVLLIAVFTCSADRQLAEADDVGRIEQTLDVFLEAEHGWSLIGGVATNAFKHAESVLHGSTHKRHNSFAGRFQ